MTLATRVSLFFLGLLALTLAGFSFTLSFLVARYLDHQQDQRVESALTALTATVEIKSDRVEWEPHERRLDLGSVCWRVQVPGGRVVGSSAEPFPAELLQTAGLDDGLDGRRDQVMGPDGEPWRVQQLRLAPSGPQPVPGRRPPAPHEDGEYPSLVISVAASLEPMESSLRQLRWTLAGLSLAVWSLAALVGRWLCRRTLAPVSHMAASARSIPATEPGRRLEVAPTGDELETLGKSFNGLLDRLQETFERQRRFTGEASHQLRTPLAVMLGQVEVALRRDRPPEEYRRVLGIVADQSSRLHRIVEMLLFLARADAEAALPGVSCLALAPWLDEYLKAWGTHPRASDIRLNPPGEDFPVLAHPPLLGQVVDILLDNACKYSPPGTPITLSLTEKDGYVLLSVEDRGCGIAAEDLSHVFEPFFRSPHLSGTGAGGVGLGLTIAHRITTALNGRLAVESEPGHGSRFTLWLVCGGTRLAGIPFVR
jgi:two-component system, OmpR family, sensor kinase